MRRTEDFENGGYGMALNNTSQVFVLFWEHLIAPSIGPSGKPGLCWYLGAKNPAIDG